ncbi:MAG: hypothetical protein IPJ65_03695 [Archangiaceae bacterium]|nr:hypothetical protein [Archangiaceae bacterium]
MINKLLFLIGALAVLTSGCRAVDSAVDCHSICTRYRDCFDQNYGVDSCESRCRANANSDSSYYTKVDSCDACIDNNACATAVFSCGANCSSVVP